MCRMLESIHQYIYKIFTAKFYIYCSFAVGKCLFGADPFELETIHGRKSMEITCNKLFSFLGVCV